MIQIYQVDKAKKTILNRDSNASLDIPPSISAGIHKFFGKTLSPPEAVAVLINEVRRYGDEALRKWTKQIDGITVDDLAIGSDAMDQGLGRIPSDLKDALSQAIERIRQFHSLQPIPQWESKELGGTTGQRFTPIERIGVYVPGGTAPLPSSLLMSAIPAQVAGVNKIIVTTPPGQPSGTVPDVILATARLIGIEAIFKVGGALAVAAMAYGTETIPKVDKIVGPGNLFTTLAKQQVYGVVGIDGLYGPTETMVVADDTADPDWVAADLLAQAEHDVLASAILLTPSIKLAKAVQIAIGRQMETLSRADIIATSLAHRGGIVITGDLAEACELANEYAAEHTCIIAADPDRWRDKIQNAGGLFIGERSFEVLGDYVAGPSHVMPTGGSARFSSPLNVLDFMKISSIIQLDDRTSTNISPIAARIAQSEHLTAHANAAMKRVTSPENLGLDT